METIFADGAYGGAKLRRAMDDAAWRIELAKRSAQAKGFEVIPRRRVVERTIAWINRCQRLAKDYENLNAHSRSRPEVNLAERVHGKHPLATVNGVWQGIGCVVGIANEPELILNMNQGAPHAMRYAGRPRMIGPTR